MVLKLRKDDIVIKIKNDTTMSHISRDSNLM
jgi:hypothetical protein